MRSAIRLATAAGLLALLATVPACASASSATHPTASHPASVPAKTANTFGGTPTVGALFLSLAVPLHICSASVVASADKSVILTAAHCVRGGRGAGYAFAPGYHDGKAPFGFWRVTAAYGAPAWIKHTNDHDDFAFLTVAPRRIKGKLTDLQSVTGANRLGVAPKRGTAVTVTGYPLGVGGSPIHCRTKVFYDGAFPGFHCDGFADGTSGGPWVAGGGHRRTVVGLIAGLHQGGCVASTSYSSVLGAAAQAALRRAAHHKPGDDFPSPPGDGC